VLDEQQRLCRELHPSAAGSSSGTPTSRSSTSSWWETVDGL
jgi:hypothetical protein